jgi:hypothetical protein
VSSYALALVGTGHLQSPKIPGHRLVSAPLAAVGGTGRFPGRSQEGGVPHFAALPQIATRQLLCGW